MEQGMSADILIIDDESDIRNLIQGILEDEGYYTREAENDEKAYSAIAKKTPDLIILDIWLQGSRDDGMDILRHLKEEHPLVPVIMISGHGTIETAVNAIKIGAYDFIEKPFKSDRLLLMIERALDNAKLRKENIRLKEKAEGPSELIGDSSAMTALRQVMERVAQTNSRVLLSGPPGVGKNLAARYIHRLSQRADGPFLTVNCAILHPERLEAELFGSTDEGGGQLRQTGVLEQANGGTLLLDEVADMPLETQGKIVRVLQEQKFQRFGNSEHIDVDVRIIASSNRDLQAAMEDNRFRQDLYYRLNVVPLDIPPLNERAQDIPVLIEYFIKSYSDQSGLPPCEFSQEATALMQAYEWPGNVRQLRNVIEWVMIMCGGGEKGVIEASRLPPEISAGSSPASDNAKSGAIQTQSMGLPLREARELFERDYLHSQIKRFGGNISKTAEFIGMERSALHRKLKQLGLSAILKNGGTTENGEETGHIARSA